MANLLERLRRAQSFQSGAERFDRFRPNYPSEAVDLMVPEGTQRILELGAGTGLLTQDLVKRVPEVVVVDPSEDMLSILSRRAPAAQQIHGTAEFIRLPDNDVDAVVTATAWHWMDPVTTSAEVARVLKPGGQFAIVWNLEAAVPGWHQSFAEIQPQSTATPGGMIAHAEFPTAPFGPTVRHFIPWVRRFPTANLVDLYTTHSAYRVMSPTQRLIRKKALEHVVNTHPDLQDEFVDLHMVTEVWITHLMD